MRPCAAPHLLQSRSHIPAFRLRCIFAALVVLLFAASVKPAFAGDRDRVSFAQRIVVEQNDTAGDVVCFLCSVEVHGKVDGDIVTFLGGVKSDGQMHGDLVSFLGDVNLSSNSALDGQIVVMGGKLRKGDGVRLGDNQVIFPITIFVVPLIFLVALIWGISRIFRPRPVYFRPLR